MPRLLGAGHNKKSVTEAYIDLTRDQLNSNLFVKNTIVHLSITRVLEHLILTMSQKSTKLLFKMHSHGVLGNFFIVVGALFSDRTHQMELAMVYLLKLP